MKKIVLALILCIVSSLFVFAQAATETPAAETKESVEILYWSQWEATEPQGIVIAEAAKAFEKETGIKVNIEFKGRSGIKTTIEPSIDAGIEIDLFDDNFDRSNGQWTKLTLNLEDLYKKYNYEEYALPAVIANCRAVSGDIHVVPYQPSVYAFVYNTEIFEKAGIAKTPETWDEFLDCCEKIKAAGFNPCTSDDAYALQYLGFYLARLAGQDVVLDLAKNGGWAKNEYAQQAAKAFEDMAKKGYFSPYIASNVYPAGQNGEFALGETAMLFCGSFLPNELKKIVGDDYVWGAFPFPTVPGGTCGFEYANISGTCLNINAKSKHADEAFQFAMYLTRGDWDKKLSTETIGVPSDIRNYEWPAQLANFKQVFDLAKYRWESAAGVKSNSKTQPALKAAFIKLCAGQLTAEEFLAACDAAY